ncbi:collagen alpha-1(I) chain-like [Leopardus geoffroyi]|uniref:collagen alpha-1(I) chain-like n=1 Tax=Leopardus geoffroyi TaxID=46844 RepID=UPI001E2652DC|nr:collagen alpha-1(I) chain-like [Leopardus geoffroyi]
MGGRVWEETGPPPRSPGPQGETAVCRVQSLIFTDGNCGPERRRRLPGSHEEGALPGPDAGPPDPGQCCAQPRERRGRRQGPFPVVSECGAFSPARNLRSDHAAPGQSWCPGPNPEKVARRPRASLRGGGRRRAERWPHALRPRDSGERESTLGTPGGQKLGGTVGRSQAAGSCSGPGPLHSASVHTLPGVKGGPDSRRPGPFRREGKQKVEESGRRTPDPSSAHLVPPRPGGSRSESARRGSRGTAAVSTESWPPRPRPLLGLRPAPPRPRPPGAPGTGWLAPRQAPPREEGSRSGLRVAGMPSTPTSLEVQPKC